MLLLFLLQFFFLSLLFSSVASVVFPNKHFQHSKWIFFRKMTRVYTCKYKSSIYTWCYCCRRDVHNLEQIKNACPIQRRKKKKKKMKKTFISAIRTESISSGRSSAAQNRIFLLNACFLVLFCLHWISSRSSHCLHLLFWMCTAYTNWQESQSIVYKLYGCSR